MIQLQITTDDFRRVLADRYMECLALGHRVEVLEAENAKLRKLNQMLSEKLPSETAAAPASGDDQEVK